MGKNLIIVGQEYLNEFKNGVAFTDNLGDYTNNFTGSVMENEKVKLTIDVSWYSQALASSPFTTSSGGTVINWNSDFVNDGFSVGDTITFERIDASGTILSTHTGTIASISATTMVLTAALSPALADGVYSASKIHGTTPLTALVYKFGLIENSSPFSVQNIITGNDQSYYGSGMTSGGGFIPFIKVGQVEDWKTGDFQAQKLVNPSTYVQRFELEHEIMIPFYSEGDDLTLLPTYLDGLKSLKYVFEAGFRTVISDPNTEKAFQYDAQLGSVGGYNESLNGQQNNYSIKSINYEEQATSNAADGLLIGSKTRVTIVVENLGGVFSGADRFGVYVGYKAEQTRYQNTTTTDFKDNFIYDRALNNVASIPTSGDVFITNNSSTIDGFGDMVIVFDVEYTSGQKSFLSNQFASAVTEFVIGVSVGDVTLTSGNSDRVMLLAANTLYDQNPDIPDLMNVTKFDVFPHSQQIGVGTPSTDMVSWNEDGLVIDFEFSLNLLRSAILNTLDFKLIAYNIIDETYFELDSFSYGVSQIISSGSQQLNVTTNRGYILKSGDQFNDVTLTTDALVGDDQFYSGRFAQKVSWQEWIQNLDVDNVFFDASEPNDNKNDKSSNYSLLNDYEIRLAIAANLDGVSDLGVAGNTNYLFVSPTITVHDYEEDGLEPPVWSCVIETFNNANMSNLNGAILSGQDTLFKATWTKDVGGPATSIVGLWGVNRIEETGQLGYAITEMSSLNDPATNQLLIPTVGFTLLDLYLDSGNIVMECLIDGSLVVPGKSYNLSSRIHDGNIIIEGKETEGGTFKDTEGGTIKIIE